MMLGFLVIGIILGNSSTLHYCLFIHTALLEPLRLQMSVSSLAPTLGSFQLVQEKLARMLANVQAMFLMCWRLSKLYEEVSPAVSSIPIHTCRTFRVLACSTWSVFSGNNRYGWDFVIVSGN